MCGIPLILYLLQGPNLNLLGTREPSLYGSRSLSDLVDTVRQQATGYGWKLKDFQTNHEGEMLEYIHQIPDKSWMVINAGAWTHTSIALRDALVARSIRFVEVHISRIHARESFRGTSYLADKAQAQISGFGVDGYRMALEFIEFMDSEQAA